jgi:hypothetical protein
MSYKQLDWQERKRELGLCTTCGKNPLTDKHNCKECRDKKRVTSKNRYYRIAPNAVIYKCSVCHQYGHNKRTCTVNND